jgi:hypothetical protein
LIVAAAINRRTLLTTLVAAGLYRGSAFAETPGPLPSWSDSTRQSIMSFVDRVTREGGPDYVTPAERILRHALSGCRRLHMNAGCATESLAERTGETGIIAIPASVGYRAQRLARFYRRPALDTARPLIQAH